MGGWSGSKEKQAATWLRKQHGKNCFAPFTGQDWRAFAAWIHCLELWFGSDHQGQEWALEALRCCVSCAQPKCWPLFKAAIPAIGDWSHEEELWRKLELDRTFVAEELARKITEGEVPADPRWGPSPGQLLRLPRRDGRFITDSFGRCGKWIDNRVVCVLAPGHDGTCSPRLPGGSKGDS